MKERKYCELSELKKLLKRKFAKVISISTDALNNKLNGYSYFNIEEADKIVRALKIDVNDIGLYFFPECCVTQQNDEISFALTKEGQYKII